MYDNYDPVTCQKIVATVIVGSTSTYITITSLNMTKVASQSANDITIIGGNLNHLTAAKFSQSGSPDINGVIVSSGSNSAVVHFVFNSAPTGYYDLLLTNNVNEVSPKKNAIQVL
jgi:hypothetical protein